MSHEEFVWDLIRNIAGGTIVFLLCLLLKRRIARHDAEREADKEWRESVDRAILGIERRKHPRSPTPRETNGLDKHDSAPRGPRDRLRKPRLPDEE